MVFRFTLRAVLAGALLAAVGWVAVAQTSKTPSTASTDASASTNGAPETINGNDVNASPDRARKGVEAIFLKADTNQDGKLSNEEASRVPAISAIFNRLNKGQKGYVTVEEFKAAAQTLPSGD